LTLSYFIKEIFYSIQGEGFYSGRPSVFAVLPVVIYGREKKPIVKRPFVSFVIRIL